MIEIDKTDFLFKYLSALGEENIEETYQEFAQNGVTNAKDFRKYLYSKYADHIDKEIDEESLADILTYYVDIKKNKKVSATELTMMLSEYKISHNKDLFKTIVASKLKDLIFTACLYNMKYDNVELCDIVQVCNLGLMTAVEKYNEKTKIPFDDYIEYWINKEMTETFTKEKNNG